MKTSKPAVSVNDDQVTITVPRATAEALRDELLWVKVDEDGPIMDLWKTLDTALPDHSLGTPGSAQYRRCEARPARLEQDDPTAAR